MIRRINVEASTYIWVVRRVPGLWTEGLWMSTPWSGQDTTLSWNWAGGWIMSNIFMEDT